MLMSRRPIERVAMTETVQLDVPLLLPEVCDRDDRCLVSLVFGIRSVPGVTRVGVRGDAGRLRLCIDHDPEVIDGRRVGRIVRAEGRRLSARIGHLSWAVCWIEDRRVAREVWDELQGLVGVLDAEVVPGGTVRVEYDRGRIDAATIERSLHALGIRRQGRPAAKGRRGGAGSLPGPASLGRRAGIGVFAGVGVGSAILAGVPA